MENSVDTKKIQTELFIFVVFIVDVFVVIAFLMVVFVVIILIVVNFFVVVFVVAQKPNFRIKVFNQKFPNFYQLSDFA